MSKAWINSQKVNTGFVNFKNKIINTVLDHDSD